ncbi:MAG: FAD:protein FMN transferase [Clostridia bacterium]|nr:FAD:protein FMN transferase [Clostridia bacterium]
MSLLRKFLTVFLAIALLFSFSGCKSLGGVLDFAYFNTAVHIETHDKPISAQTETLIKNTLSNFENEFSTNKETSLIYNFNLAKKDASFNLSDLQAQVLKQGKDAFLFTGGLFNPAVYPLVKLWGFAPYSYTPNYTPPTQEQIQSALSLCDFNNAQIDFENKVLTKTNEHTKLDLSGLVKGVCADAVAQILKDAGHTSGYVNIGGSSLNLLKVSSLGIRHPEKAGESLLTVNTKNYADLSVSTSGDYERYYTDSDGNRYTHLINPFTGKTANTGVSSATIIGINGGLGDALTTALCLCEYSAVKTNSPLTILANKIITEYPDCMIFIVYKKEQTKLILTNKTLNQHFTITDQSYSVVNI